MKRVRRDSRSVGVRDLALCSFALEDAVQLLALLSRGVLDLDRAALRDNLFSRVRSDQTLEAVRLHTRASVSGSSLATRGSEREAGANLEPLFNLFDLLLKEFVFLRLERFNHRSRCLAGKGVRTGRVESVRSETVEERRGKEKREEKGAREGARCNRKSSLARSTGSL